MLQAFRRFDKIFAAQALPHDNGQAFAVEVVGHGQRAEMASIEERIADEIHAPALVGCSEYGSIQSIRRGPALRWSLGGKILPWQLAQLMYALAIDRPVFVTQQDMDALIAIAHPRLASFVDAPGKWRSHNFAHRFVHQPRAGLAHHDHAAG